ncbi:hypothetical protein SNEBB_003430 [Seison nebaliae]|nr:hypothetical protein SNEBB_003430 [Seison nebaliae]
MYNSSPTLGLVTLEESEPSGITQYQNLREYRSREKKMVCHVVKMLENAFDLFIRNQCNETVVNDTIKTLLRVSAKSLARSNRLLEEIPSIFGRPFSLLAEIVNGRRKVSTVFVTVLLQLCSAIIKRNSCFAYAHLQKHSIEMMFFMKMLFRPQKRQNCLLPNTYRNDLANHALKIVVDFADMPQSSIAIAEALSKTTSFVIDDENLIEHIDIIHLLSDQLLLHRINCGILIKLLVHVAHLLWTRLIREIEQDEYAFLSQSLVRLFNRLSIFMRYICDSAKCSSIAQVELYDMETPQKFHKQFLQMEATLLRVNDKSKEFTSLCRRLQYLVEELLEQNRPIAEKFERYLSYLEEMNERQILDATFINFLPSTRLSY